MSQPRILFVDIETRPALAYVWRLYDENVGLEQLLEPSSILSVGWKWKGTKAFHYADVWPVRSKTGRARMLRAIYDEMGRADAVVTFNGGRFDLPKLTGEFLVAGFKPLAQVTSIDTIRTTKKMGFTSNKLAHVLPLLGLGNKLDTGGFRLWREYMEGKQAARLSMKLYNEGDVRGLERLYDRILPYITDHPYLGDYAGTCPNCGSARVQHRGYRRTRSFKIERIQCNACGTWTSGKRTIRKAT